MADVLLMRDALENLIDLTQGGPEDVDLRIKKRVIREAFREFVDRVRWGFYDQEMTIVLDSTTTTLRAQYVNSTRYLKSSFAVTNSTNTSPVVVTIDSDFAGVDGETIYVKNINNVADGSYVLNEVGTNQFELTGSTSTGAFSATGNEIAYRTTFTSSQVGGRVKFSGVATSYPIIKYVDQWTLLLSATSNPGADVSGGLATIDFARYELPEDFISMGFMTDSNVLAWSESYIAPEEWLGLEQTLYNTSTHPFRWTVMPSRVKPNRWDLCWVGSPGDNRRMSFMYRRRPNDALRFSGVENGATSAADGNQRVATTAGSTTVTGTATSFNSSMVGAWIRIGPEKASSRSEPSGLDGRNPYVEQHRIAAVASATSLTLETPAANTASSQAFVVSDLIDIDVSHYNAFYALCELKYAEKTYSKDRIAAAQVRHRNTLILAMEMDQKYHSSRSAMDQFVAPTPFGSPRNASFGTFVSTPAFG